MNPNFTDEKGSTKIAVLNLPYVGLLSDEKSSLVAANLCPRNFNSSLLATCLIWMVCSFCQSRKMLASLLANGP